MLRLLEAADAKARISLAKEKAKDSTTPRESSKVVTFHYVDFGMIMEEVIPVVVDCIADVLTRLDLSANVDGQLIPVGMKGI